MSNFVEPYIEKDMSKSAWYLIMPFGSTFISKWLALSFRNTVKIKGGDVELEILGF